MAFFLCHHPRRHTPKNVFDPYVWKLLMQNINRRIKKKLFMENNRLTICQKITGVSSPDQQRFENNRTNDCYRSHFYIKLGTWFIRKTPWSRQTRKPTTVVEIFCVHESFCWTYFNEIISVTSEKCSEFLDSSNTTPVHKIHMVIHCDLYSI